MLFVGCHLSSAKGFAAMGRTACGIGATTFAFFTRNPRGGAIKALDLEDASALRALLTEEGFGVLVAHAPYTYNLCSAKRAPARSPMRRCARTSSASRRCPGTATTSIRGSHVGQGADAGIELIARALADIMEPGMRARVLLETMAGKGTEVGGRFEELAAIIAAAERLRPDLAGALGVCLDTCHVHDAGYDIVNDLDGVLDEFDRVVGLERLAAVHLNDSKNPLGSRKDRHARLCEGYIGSPELGGSPEAFARIVRDPRLRGLPFILETPNELAGYAREIAWLRALAAGGHPDRLPHAGDAAEA